MKQHNVTILSSMIVNLCGVNVISNKDIITFTYNDKEYTFYNVGDTLEFIDIEISKLIN